MTKILVADDNSNIQKMVTLALKGLGIEVVAVGNGEAAVRKLPELQPDLVLADVFMPVRSGYEVCEFVKTDARFAHIPVILLVGTFDPLDEKETQRVGADGVLKKPFVPPEPLITMVRATLEKAAHLHPSEIEPATQDLPSAPAAKEAAPEPDLEEFITRPAPIQFQEDERPTAFSDLLEMATTALDREVEASRRERQGAEEEESSEVPAEAEPDEDLGPIEPALEHSFGREEFDEPEPEPEPEPEGWHPEALSAPEIPTGAEANETSDLGFTTPPWARTTSRFPAPTSPETPASESDTADEEPALPDEEPALPDEAPAEATAFPRAAEPPVEATAFPRAAEPPVEEPEPEPEAEFEEPTLEQAPPSAEIEWPSGPPEPAVPVEEESMADRVKVDSEVLDTVVQRVMASLQPQILNLVSQNIVRPVVEAFLQRELDKKE